MSIERFEVRHNTKCFTEKYEFALTKPLLLISDPTPEEMAEIAIKTLEKIELNVKKKKEISGEVQCDICWKFYKNKTTLNSHKANTHKAELTTCDICKKFCKTKSHLSR